MSTSRRAFLTAGALSLVGWAARPRTALGGVFLNGSESHGGLLVTLFLRGGADGLSLVVPYGDDDYYRNRPTLAVRRPATLGVKPADRVVDLDGFFGFHPELQPLYPLYAAGQLALVHACGSGDQTRSHFEAMATMERGLYRDAGPASGWLARHLQSAPWENDSPLRAVALGAMIPETLRGASNTTALRTVTDLHLQVPFPDRATAIRESLETLYNPVDRSLLNTAGHEALCVLKSLDRMDPAGYRPSGGAIYPKDDLGEGLRQVALLAKSDVGLEAACLDHGSFDTHVAQAGFLPGRLQSLSHSVAAFAANLGPERWNSTTVVVLSEFGRRVEENSGAGTDHGRGGVMMVMGGQGICGGKVHGQWPGLAPEKLEGPGDLRVTSDYRNVLAEVIDHRLGNPNISSVFPGLDRKSVGVVV